MATPCGGSGLQCAGAGTIFSLTPPGTQGGAWTEAIEYVFTDGITGADPGGLILSPKGKMYGFAYSGNVFTFQP